MLRADLQRKFSSVVFSRRKTLLFWSYNARMAFFFLFFYLTCFLYIFVKMYLLNEGIHSLVFDLVLICILKSQQAFIRFYFQITLSTILFSVLPRSNYSWFTVTYCTDRECLDILISIKKACILDVVVVVAKGIRLAPVIE